MKKKTDISRTGRSAAYKKRRIAYLVMVIPLIAYLAIFCYLPMAGTVMAFQNFRPARGFFKSAWVGLDNFKLVFQDSMFWSRLRNTVIISVLKILFTAPAPIILALMLNEVRNKPFKRTVQTIVYMPRFISWVVLASIIRALLDVQNGPVNSLLINMNLIDNPILFMGEKSLFRSILVISEVWKTVGWSTIIYISALTSVDPTYYEAAELDGASRFQKMWYITLPFIKPTFMILIILSMGSILNAGFDQLYVLSNQAVLEVGDIIDTYVYRRGLAELNYS